MNELLPRVTRYFLLYADAAKLISVRWSHHILDKLREHLPSRGHTPEQVAAILTLLEDGWQDALVDIGPGDYAALVALHMDDREDKDVLAAAIAADADVICTENTSDFPLDVARSFAVSVETFDQLFTRVLEERPVETIDVFRIIADLLGDGERVTTWLAKAGAAAFAQRVTEASAASSAWRWANSLGAESSSSFSASSDWL
ncbi:MAG: PIN domain-containing protein [Propionibacteriaceae bacterium]|nr:PIN domain-containing protein [Propionibacteriaceae bacterium]